MTTYFLDVPVYRLGEREYYRQRKEFVDKGLAPLREDLGEEISKHRGMEANFEEHLIRRFGGMWRFNEVIGYIRLYFLGSQVRGEYVAVAKKRLVRSRTKRFEIRALSLAQIDIEQPFTEESILAAIRQNLASCQRNLPRRHVDLSGLEVLAKHVRWCDLWKATNPFARR